MDKKEIEKKIINLLQIVNKKMEQNIETHIQKELGIYMHLLNDIFEDTEFSYLYYTAESAILSLLSDTPNIEYAKKVRRSIINSIRSKKYILRNIIFSKSPSSKVIFGLAALLYISIPILLILSNFYLIPDTLFNIETNEILPIIFFGALGSIASIMVRINDFSKMKDVESSLLFFTGFFKPIIGICFSVFIYALWKSEIIQIPIVNLKNEKFLFIVISFIAGFSERFVKDVMEKAKNIVVVSNNTKNCSNNK